MELWQLILIIGTLLSATIAFIWNALHLGAHHNAQPKKQNHSDQVEEDVDHIFSDDFREELKNRGTLYFEKIIKENAMFLQQDLRLTTSQMNDYMKEEITRTLKAEFSKYEQSITDAKQLAIDSINKTQEAIEQQRHVLGDQLQAEFDKEKSRLVKHFEDNMADIVNHYIMGAIGNQIDLDDQLEYILGQLENSKKEIIEDITSGA